MFPFIVIFQYIKRRKFTMKYILAYDLGTSGNKATLFSEGDKMIGSEVFSYDAHYFNGTWGWTDLYP